MTKLIFKKLSTGLLIAITVMAGLAHAEMALSPVIQQATTPVSQIPSDESLEKLMRLQQIDKSIEAENQQAEKMLQQSIANLFKETNISPEKKANVQKIFQNFIEYSMKDLNNPSIRAQYKANFIDTTKAIYNQQEVNAMIDFTVHQ